MSEETLAKIIHVWSQTIPDLEPHPELLAKFVYLIEKIDGLPTMERRFHREGLSLYHAISKSRAIEELEDILMIFFEDAPAKMTSADDDLPIPGAAAQHLGGFQPGQSLFIKKLGEAEFYGALWPWKDKENVVTVHMGVCVPGMTDENHQVMYLAMKGHLTESTSEMIDAGVSGRIRGISLSSFLQMSEMDASTCTLSIRGGDREGTLHLLNGNLIDAETGNLKRREAAFAILRWENAEIKILKPSGRKKNEIGMPLMQILMEALKEKDESEFYLDTQHEVTLPKDDPFDVETVPSASSLEGRDESAAVAEPEHGEEKVTPDPVPDGGGSDESGALVVDQEALETSAAGSSDVPAEEGLVAAPAETSEGSETIEPKAAKPKKKIKRHKQPGFPEKKKKGPLVAVAVIVVLLLGVGAFFILQGKNGETAEEAYATLMSRLERLKDGDEKVKLLNAFIDAHQEDAAYTGQAVDKLLAVLAEMEASDYEQAVSSVYALPLNSAYHRKAHAIFSAFLEKHPESRHRPEISKKLAEIAALTEDTYYSELGNIDSRDYVARLEAYRAFLSEYPQGRYKEKVDQLIVEALKASYRDFLTKIRACKNRKQWDDCVAVCRQYRQTYGPYMKMDAVNAAEKEVLTLKALELLKAEIEGADEEAVLKLLRAFLEEYPDNPERERLVQRAAEIEKNMALIDEWSRLKTASQDSATPLSRRIERLENYITRNPNGPYTIEAENLKWRLEQSSRTSSTAAKAQPVAPTAKTMPAEGKHAGEMVNRAPQLEAMKQKLSADLKQTKGRFTINQDRTIRDTVTGLTWSALDSYQVLGRCLNYRETVQYVSQLSDGGHQDWRLPTAAELAGIYQNSPYFPASGADWYWSSEVYEKGYQTIVNIVSAKPDIIYTNKTAMVRKCGTVRAVRP